MIPRQAHWSRYRFTPRLKLRNIWIMKDRNKMLLRRSWPKWKGKAACRLMTSWTSWVIIKWSTATPSIWAKSFSNTRIHSSKQSITHIKNKFNKRNRSPVKMPISSEEWLRIMIKEQVLKRKLKCSNQAHHDFVNLKKVSIVARSQRENKEPDQEFLKKSMN